MVNLPKADRHFDVECNILHFMSKNCDTAGIKVAARCTGQWDLVGPGETALRARTSLSVRAKGLQGRNFARPDSSWLLGFVESRLAPAPEHHGCQTSQNHQREVCQGRPTLRNGGAFVAAVVPAPCVASILVVTVGVAFIGDGAQKDQPGYRLAQNYVATSS